jgi:hypothetical protein
MLPFSQSSFEDAVESISNSKYGTMTTRAQAITTLVSLASCKLNRFVWCCAFCVNFCIPPCASFAVKQMLHAMCVFLEHHIGLVPRGKRLQE